MNVETLIFAYLSICVSMILFNIACIFVFEAKDRQLQKRSRKMEHAVEEQFYQVEKGEPVSNSHTDYLSWKLRNISHLMVFDETMERLRQVNPDVTDTYLKEVCSVFIYLMESYSKKSELKAAYFLYIIYKYGIMRNNSETSMNRQLLDMVRSQNLYCRENALKALYSIGDVDAVMEALHILDREEVYHNPKLLSDGLLLFAGSHSRLCEQIWDKFDSFSVDMRVTLLNYMRFQSGEHGVPMLRLLSDKKQNAEIQYACIRYFGKYPAPEAYPILLDFVENEQERSWEYAAIAATALASYQGEKTVQVLKRLLSSRNWYVRLNAAKSLEDLGLGYVELIDIFEGGDRYASEILRYCMDMKKAREKGVNQT